MSTEVRLLVLVCIFTLSTLVLAQERGLANSTTSKNQALLVGVGHGLPGIDLDIGMMEGMASHTAYQFQVTKLMEGEGIVSNVLEGMEGLSKGAKNDGTLLFYFSGHGNVGTLWLSDKNIAIQKLRLAIEAGRSSLGPLARLVLIFDSCYSGSLLDPFRRVLPLSEIELLTLNEQMADEVVRQLTPTREESSYWNTLMVLASSRADEPSLATPNGSMFTVAMKKAFNETIDENRTVGEFLDKAREYTSGHHPVARLVPSSLESEAMVPQD